MGSILKKCTTCTTPTTTQKKEKGGGETTHATLVDYHGPYGDGLGEAKSATKGHRMETTRQETVPEDTRRLAHASEQGQTPLGDHRP